MTATICEPTGRLTTGKCSESKWSNDFISLLLLVRSITFVFFMIREKNKVIIIRLSRQGLVELVPHSFPDSALQSCAWCPWTWELFASNSPSCISRELGCISRLSENCFTTWREKFSVWLLYLKSMEDGHCSKLRWGGILIYLQGPGCKHGAAITADLRPTSLPSSASPWTLPGVITFSVGERGFGYQES